MGKRSRNLEVWQRRHKAVWAVKILRGQIPNPTPEQRLWLAVIEQAVREAYAPREGDPGRRAEAREWLASEHFTDVATALGLHPQWARNTIRKLERLMGAGAREGAAFRCATSPGGEAPGRKTGEGVA